MSESSDIQNMRRSYEQGELNESSFPQNPFTAFDLWFNQAKEQARGEANAMSLATVDGNQKPSVRTVLLKGFDERGFVLFTNYRSRKSKEIETNPHVSLLFHWNSLERQVRIEGRAEKTSREETEAYFSTRPRESQIGAWASPQSEPLNSREDLVQLEKEVEEKFKGLDIPAPEFWGGYRVIPERIEFWQGRKGRLHDRLVYERSDSEWIIKRLAP